MTQKWKRKAWVTCFWMRTWCRPQGELKQLPASAPARAHCAASDSADQERPSAAPEDLLVELAPAQLFARCPPPPALRQASHGLVRRQARPEARVWTNSCAVAEPAAPDP